MANLKFEGEIDGISERQLEFIRSVLEKRGFKNERVIISNVGKADDNYAANVLRFVVEKNGETFKMVGKIASANENIRKNMMSKVLYQNEHVMYTHLLPKFSELEKGADIPEHEKFRYTTCYGSLSEEPNEVILLEDLQMSNFVMMDKSKSLDNDTVRMVLKNFAKFHSLSYALKNREPEIFETFKSRLLSGWATIMQTDMAKSVCAAAAENAMKVLDNDKHKNMVKNIPTLFTRETAKNAKIDKDSKYSVIAHGDSWTNNMLFKLEGEKLVQCCLLDYQLSLESSPAIDIIYMIFNCTDHETRSQYFHEWIDYYHEQLNKSLDNFGLKASFIYPKGQLDADLKRFGKFGFAMSIFGANILIRDSLEAIRVKEAMKSNNDMSESFSLSNLANSSMLDFKARIGDSVASCLELGYM